ncbi:cation channel sperm-associated protein 2-like [Rhincodon typus]|uniref:cation channel sperm-associated protein 2-like n=1 Tax=Rhincodon typus TaxID=259920 RepID=UPI0009A305EB|nr:cation channel sperm-associated protein 2-like [Rhincodon typus]
MDTFQERKGVSQIHSKENPRAEIIRAKLVQDFNLLDHLQGLVINDPKYNMNDVKDPKVLNKLIIEDPLQLVRFDFNPVRNVNVSSNYRQRNCLQNRYVKYPPLNMWAQWILDSSFFRNLILYLIILNTIVFGVLVDVADKPGPKFHAVMTMLVIIDWCILSVLTSEIILRWLYDFVNFWKSGWNVFDLTVLITSLVPEVVKGTHLKTSIELYFLKVTRIFRALRSLKMMRRFHQVRLILLAITKAFKTMTFILLLVLIFAYVFAVVGVSLFRTYTESDKPGLIYHSSFRDILHTLQTLFQLFTMDHWYALLTDIWQVEEIDTIASGIYIMLWILIGSFIFRNIIVGIMVSNFQSIRKDLAAQIKQLETQRKADHFKLQMMQRRLSPEIRVRDVLNKGERQSESELTHVSEMDFRSSSHASHSSEISYKAGKDWESYVRKNIKLMQSNLAREKVIWPRDSLFHYYELLEQLQYNLCERKKLQFLAAQALVNMHDV